MKRAGANKSRLKEYQALLKVVQALQAEKDLDSLLELIIQSITQVLGAERSSLFLYDPKEDVLYDKIAQDFGQEVIRLPMGQGIAGTVAKTLSALNIKDAYKDHRFDSSWDAKSGFRTRNILAMPLVTHEGKLIGVIEALNKYEGPFTPADLELLSAFSTHAAIAIDSAFLIQQYIEKQRIEHEIKVARSIQQGLLPRELPEVGKVRLAAHLEPCEDASGDYYDVFPVSPDELALVIADVTGHGLGPALIMSATRALIRACNSARQEPGQVLAEVNRQLANDLTEGRFVTCCLVILNSRTGALHYSNAGHEHAYIRRKKTGKWISLSTTGIPLGIFADEPITTGKSYRMQKGDLLLLATDGFSETFDKNNQQMFGAKRLQEAADSADHNIPAKVINTICQKVHKFTGGTPQKDDQTLLIATMSPE